MDVFVQFDESLETVWSLAAAREPVLWPFLRFGWHKTWHAYLGSEERLTIMHEPTRGVLLPLSVHGSTAHFTGGEEIADYLDVFGGQLLQEHWKEVFAQLKRAGASTLDLRNIPQHSKTLAYFRSVRSATISAEDTTPLLPLPASFDTYLQTLDRKKRHEIKRKLRRFETAYPTAHYSLRDSPDIPLLLRLMKHNADKRAFLTQSMESFFTALPSVAPDAIRQAVLTVDGNIAATVLLFLVSGSVLLYNSGYDPRIEGSGWYLKTKIIEWAIEQNLSSLNFLQGGERYKYDLGATDALVYRVQLTI